MYYVCMYVCIKQAYAVHKCDACLHIHMQGYLYVQFNLT